MCYYGILGDPEFEGIPQLNRSPHSKDPDMYICMEPEWYSAIDIIRQLRKKSWVTELNPIPELRPRYIWETEGSVQFNSISEFGKLCCRRYLNALALDEIFERSDRPEELEIVNLGANTHVLQFAEMLKSSSETGFLLDEGQSALFALLYSMLCRITARV